MRAKERPHHLDVWPMRERAFASLFVAVSVAVLFAFAMLQQWWALPITMLLWLRADRSFDRQWLAACKRYGVDEKETRGF